MRSLMQLLKDKDPTLSKNLVSWKTAKGDIMSVLVLKVKKGVEPQFFGFRWITLLLSQEFLLPGGELHHYDTIFVLYHNDVIGCRIDANMGLSICRCQSI